MSRKNTSSPSQRVKFFWHPAPDCSSPALFRAGFAFIPRRRFMAEISGSQSVRRQATCWHHANHGSIGGSRQVAALWLCWVVRGSIWWPVRLVVYPAQDTCPRTRARSHPSSERQPGERSGCVVMRAYAACEFRCLASNTSPFFHRIRAMAAILRASVSRASAGCIPFATLAW